MATSCRLQVSLKNARVVFVIVVEPLTIDVEDYQLKNYMNIDLRDG